jgi:hypothetical protein
MQFVSDISTGSHESIEGVVFLILTAINGNVHGCGFSAGVEQHLRNVGEADAGIGELSLDHGADFLAQRFGNAVSMMLTCPGFRHPYFPGLNL